MKIGFPVPSERESIIADAASTAKLSPRERMEVFADLLRTVDAIWAHLPPEERRRRMKIADLLNRRPDPWWKNLRLEAQPDLACSTSSD